MISGIGNTSYVNNMQMQQSPPPKMTQDQKDMVTSILEEFDANNLTEADAVSIVSSLQEAGIVPGHELAQVMAESGFDAEEIGQLAGVTTPPPAPEGGHQGHSMSLNITDEMLQDLNALLDEYFSDDISDEDKESTLEAIKAIFQQTVPEGGLIDLTA